MATMATLYGMTPPLVETCRVLEIGCATGENLLSMAVTLPKASFVGIDYSVREIEAGVQRLKATRLSNVDLRCVSLMDVQPNIGKFDYMICHGVYSWVAPEVADRLLSLYARHLSPQGIGYISYNTYPGWHLKSIIRDALRYHVREISGVQQQVDAARTYLHALANSVPTSKEIYAKVIQEGAKDIDTYPDDYVYHEFLEEWNCPIYFSEFMERVESKGLKYIGPGKFTRCEASLPADLQQVISAIPKRTAREQYVDYFSSRSFRQSLVCRTGNAVLESPSLAALQTCYVSTDLRPISSDAVLDSSDSVCFRSSTQDELTTNKPHVKLALQYLAAHAPRPVPFASIWPAIESRLRADGDPSSSPAALAQALLQCFQGNMVDLMVSCFPIVLEVSSRPIASPLARSQAVQYERVSNLRHRLIPLSDFERLVVANLDGTKDRTDLCHVLCQAIDRGALDLLDHNGHPVTDPALRERCVQNTLDPCLERLAAHALLLG
jgi:methyltransferase-like protein/SAM-dependent methyltransferase